MPRSLRSVAGVRAARTKEKTGHSGRDDNQGKFAPRPPQTILSHRFTSRGSANNFSTRSKNFSVCGNFACASKLSTSRHRECK